VHKIQLSSVKENISRRPRYILLTNREPTKSSPDEKILMMIHLVKTSFALATSTNMSYPMRGSKPHGRMLRS
jgi:hypothetical protein